MTHELILTSVSQGLEPDSRGFCAVAEDRSIPRYLQMRLETLSEYRHLFPPVSETGSEAGSENGRLQPVVYSHLIFPGQETTWHALSRIGDAGIDFQSEPNRVAHHVALQDHEFVPEGPAWLLTLPGFHLTQWQTPSVRFTKGRPLPSLTAPPPLTRRQRIARERRWADPAKMNPDTAREPIDLETLRAAVRENEEQIVIAKPPSSPCPTWREMTGDPGWGGILAETIRTGQETVILFKPGQNLLPLYFEAISLLPPSFFWRSTFSTWFTYLPEHVACHWKGVLADTPQAELLLQNRNLLVIDLTAPMGVAPAGPYVEFARTGVDGTLPPDEMEENLFLTDTGQDTKPYKTPDAAPTTDTMTVDAAEEEKPESVAAPDAPMIPPIVVETASGVRARKSTGKDGVLGKLLNMKSRHQFYLLYGVTFLLVLFLLVLVLDQTLDFGLIRWFQGRQSAKQSVPQAAARPEPKAKPTEDEINKAIAARDERAQKQREQRERQRAAQQQKRELSAKAKKARADFDKQKQMNRENLDEFLLDTRMPATLSMPMPTVAGNLATPPEPKIFPEFAPLYSFGLALQLDYVPLLEIPNVRIETKKLEFSRTLEPEDLVDVSGTEPEAKAEVKKGVEKPKTEKLGAAVEEGVGSVEEKPDDDLSVPDTDRFEWQVLKIENETGRETPMFHLKLTRQGLEVSWVLEGMTNQHLYDTLTSALGFLRVSAEDEKNMSRIQSIAMFQPITAKPVMVAECFGDPGASEFKTGMPFAAQPWKSLFEHTPPVAPYEFRLEVTISPDTVTVTEDTDSETASPNRFLGLFETGIQLSVPGQDAVVRFEPISIAIEGRVGSDGITWTDRYQDRVNELSREQEQGRRRLAEMKAEIDRLQSMLATVARREKLEERKQLRILQGENADLVTRQRQVEDILLKLPSAHDKLLENTELRLDFAVYLAPAPRKTEADEDETEAGEPETGEPEEMPADDDTEPGWQRLRNEESLLILKTVAEPKKPRKEEEKPEENE